MGPRTLVISASLGNKLQDWTNLGILDEFVEILMEPPAIGKLLEMSVSKTINY